MSEAKATAPRRLSIFGATGSVGRSTLDLVRQQPGRWQIVALSANGSAVELAALAREFNAELAICADQGCEAELAQGLSGAGTDVMAGGEALVTGARMDADLVVGAIVGCAGLEPVMAALESGTNVALANKEALVSAGDLMIAAARTHGARILPVDSEHNAIFQCLAGDRLDNVRSITLTASGGPFRTATLDFMRSATPEQAVAHPNWDMGAKISVDSATMMNKGLELIEAYHLFPVGLDAIKILVHPQSVIHSMVEYQDRSTLAQLGSPDMRIPIASALAWPDRMETNCKPLDLASFGTLTFEELDSVRFPAPALCRQAIASGGAAPAILNAANEIAVAAFLKRKAGFLDIAAIVETILGSYCPRAPESIGDVLAIDTEARLRTTQYLEGVKV